ncbi:MAG: hypothetical protein F4Z57_17270 [Gemmatimonadetes bacterium]|nr:hypothetical protein [Gemmatimonadota bacterium]MYC69413.1 hypothetical protein [Gemmatimonadota bacterium]
MHHRRNLQVRPAEFRQRVRRFPRDDLLRGIAQASAREVLNRTSSPDTHEEKLSVVREGYLFQIAGVCVTHCNNHRNPVVDDAAVGDLLDGFFSTRPPELDGSRELRTWQRYLSRVAYIQMPYQLSPWEPLARTLCLFGEDRRFGEPVFENRRWEAILGITLEEFLKIAFIMYAAAVRNPGGILRETLLAPNVRPAFEPVGAERALQVVDSWLARPVADLAQLGQEETLDPDDLWRFNPFYEWPIAIMDDGTYVTPSPLGVLRRFGPQGMYFIGRDAVDADANPDAFRAFTKALGLRFERYIGVQLGFIQHAQLHPEIVYDDEQRSVDYIIETPEVLVLVEVKSVAPNIDTRSGIFPDNGDVERNIQRACQQITKSAALIEQGHPDFPALDGRQMRGLVVTREPYFNLPLPFLTDVVQPASIPTTVVSSQELEVAIPALYEAVDCGTALLGALASEGDAVKTSLNPLPVDRNLLLDEIADRWRDEHRLIDPEELPDGPAE